MQPLLLNFAFLHTQRNASSVSAQLAEPGEPDLVSSMEAIYLYTAQCPLGDCSSVELSKVRVEDIHSPALPGDV